jgi:hypothetical protein
MVAAELYRPGEMRWSVESGVVREGCGRGMIQVCWRSEDGVAVLESRHQPCLT